MQDEDNNDIQDVRTSIEKAKSKKVNLRRESNNLIDRKSESNDNEVITNLNQSLH